MSKQFDTVVIGAGPGGYVAAIRAAQLGQSVACVERGHLGGVCLNWGCIPSKALIHAAEVRDEVQHLSFFKVDDVPVDVPALREWKDAIIGKLRGGIAGLFKAHGVTHLTGAATFQGPNTLTVEGPDGAQEVGFKNAIVATGARPIELPFMPRSNPLVWTSEELLKLELLPEHLICVGGGVIGMEMAFAFQKLGSKVTVVELLDDILPGQDPELVRPVKKKFKAAGGALHLKSKVSGLSERGGKAVLSVEGPDGKTFELEGDRVLASIGFRPNTESLDLDKAGVKTDDRGYIPIDPYGRSNVPHVYAIGDVTGPPFLAHRASKQGVVVSEVIAGEPSMLDFQAMPAGIFCDPEVAQVGMTEAQAKEAGHDVVVGKFNLAGLGRAMAQNATDGLVKVVGDKNSGVLLGVGIVSPRANDLITEAALAIEMGAQTADLALTVHPHPTFSEAIMEAAEDALGHAIHAPPKRKR